MSTNYINIQVGKVQIQIGKHYLEEVMMFLITNP